MPRSSALHAPLAVASLLLLGSSPSSASATKPPPAEQKAKSSLSVEVTELRNQKGRVAVALFDSEDAFPEQRRALRGRLAKIVDKKARVTFEGLEPGVYAVAVLHDENENDEMDFNFVGMPLEGYGFSNNVSGLFGPPSFEDASLRLRAGRFKTTIKTKYFGL